MSKSILTSKPKWQVVLDAVSREIAQMADADGKPFDTVRDLAARFEVSTITAKRVFDELKVRNLIRPHVGRGTVIAAGSRMETVYMVLPSGELPAEAFQKPGFYHDLYDGFRRPPFDRMFGVRPISLEFLLQHIDDFAGRAVIVAQAALMDVTPAGAFINAKRAELVRRKLNPVVFQVFAPAEGAQVGIDMGDGIRQAVGLLVEGGHERIAYLTGDAQSIWFESRFRGYLDAIRAHRLPFDPELIRITDGFDRRQDEKALQHLLDLRRPPTAVVCANISRALHVLAFCKANRRVIPRDLSVVGFGNDPEAELSTPSLTVVDPRDGDMGAAILSLLRDRREGRERKPAAVMIRPSLILRESHGPRKKGRP